MLTKGGVHPIRIKVFFTSVVLLAVLCSLLQPSTGAQQVPKDQGTPRKIVSDDFIKNRQQGGSGSPNSSMPLGGRLSSGDKSRQNQKKRTYRLASQTKADPLPQHQATTQNQLGITVWRLRPLRSNENPTGVRMLVREKTTELIPERVEADTIFREGDLIRLTIESAQAGYLYVVDRDLFADGSMGPAMLIYPWADKDGYDNHMRPGRLVDIPAQEDQPAYFTARRSTPNQVGEILTIIVSAAPLNLPIADKPIRITEAELSGWQKMWGGASERFEMEGGAGETWTHAEQQAAAHGGGRQLTREDPAPQTIYRVAGVDDKAFLVNIRLNY